MNQISQDTPISQPEFEEITHLLQEAVRRGKARVIEISPFLHFGVLYPDGALASLEMEENDAPGVFCLHFSYHDGAGEPLLKLSCHNEDAIFASVIELWVTLSFLPEGPSPGLSTTFASLRSALA